LGLYYSWKKLTEPVIMGMKSIDVRLNWKGEEILDVREGPPAESGEKWVGNTKHEMIITFTHKALKPLRVRCKDRGSLLKWMAAIKALREASLSSGGSPAAVPQGAERYQPTGPSADESRMGGGQGQRTTPTRA